MMETKIKSSYENRMVAILVFGFGLIMLYRFSVPNLAPFFMEELNMNNTQLGMVMSFFSFAWAFAGVIGGSLSDSISRKKILLAAFVLVAGVFSFLTGFAQTFVILLVIRFIMGLFCGPVFAIAQLFCLAQSSIKRRGLNMGLIGVSSVGLLGNLIGPVALVAICQIVGWRATFNLTLIPGIVAAWLIFQFLMEPDTTKIEGAEAKVKKHSLKESFVVLKNRNIQTSMIFSVFIIMWNVGMLTFTPVYLVSVRGFSPTEMSYVMAIQGLGMIVWGMLTPALSDRIGRKPVLIFFSLVGVLSVIGILLAPSFLLIGILVFFGFSAGGAFGIYQAAIAGESVDVKYYSFAVGSITLTGELIGGFVGLLIAGMLADAFGLHAALIFTGGSIVVAGFIALRYYETAPLVLAKRAKQ